MNISFKHGIEDIQFKYISHLPYSRRSILRMYWQHHPRYRFVKTCKDGKFLDVGSGSGGLQFWRKYGKPFRRNCKMYAMDLIKGEYVDHYEEFIQFDLNDEGFPWQRDFFDNIFSAHVFEHLSTPQEVAIKLGNSLKSGGKIYIESSQSFFYKRTLIRRIPKMWNYLGIHYYKFL